MLHSFRLRAIRYGLLCGLIHNSSFLLPFWYNSVINLQHHQCITKWSPIVKIVIIGGVAGGASAAARARRLSEEAEIIILERDEYVSFANCGLPLAAPSQ